MTEKRIEHIALRVAKMDENDPFEELIKLIDINGFAWFGKIGRPINLQKAKRILVKEGDQRGSLLLVCKRPRQKTGVYDYRWFDVEKISFKPPPSGTYPEYYRPKLKQFRMWFCLRTPKGRRPSIDELVTTSSRQNLTETLSYSMSAHFYCEPPRKVTRA
jgi:hypothetical protein